MARLKGFVRVVAAIQFFLVVAGHTPYVCLGATIRIGALFDLSGPNRDTGNAMLYGANSAVKVWNQSLSKLGHVLELVVADTGSREGRLLLGAMRLERREKAMLLIGPTSPHMVKVLVGYAEANEIPLIVVSGKHMLTPSPLEDLKWSYGVSPGIGHMMKSFYRHLRRSGIKRLGVLIEDTPYFEEDLRWLKAYSTEYRVKVVSVDGFSPSDTDCISQLQHIRDAGGQLVIYRGSDTFIPRLFNSLKSVPLAVTFFMDTSLDMGYSKKMSGGRLKVSIQSPLLFSDNVKVLPQKLDIIRLKNALSSTNIHRRKDVIAAAKAWDSIGLVATALKNGAYPSKRGLVKVLEGRRSGRSNIYLRYNGLIGDYTPNRKDHIGLDPEDLFLRSHI